MRPSFYMRKILGEAWQETAIVYSRAPKGAFLGEI